MRTIDFKSKSQVVSRRNRKKLKRAVGASANLEAQSSEDSLLKESGNAIADVVSEIIAEASSSSINDVLMDIESIATIQEAENDISDSNDIADIANNKVIEGSQVSVPLVHQPSLDIISANEVELLKEEAQTISHKVASEVDLDMVEISPILALNREKPLKIWVQLEPFRPQKVATNDCEDVDDFINQVKVKLDIQVPARCIRLFNASNNFELYPATLLHDIDFDKPLKVVVDNEIHISASSIPSASGSTSNDPPNIRETMQIQDLLNEESFMLAMQLTLEEMSPQNKFIGKLVQHSDISFALSLFKEDLLQQQGSYDLAKAIESAPDVPALDPSFLANFSQEEEQALADHSMAVNFEIEFKQKLDLFVADRKAALALNAKFGNVDPLSQHNSNEPSSSGGSAYDPLVYRECNICFDEKFYVMPLTCGHRFCTLCLKGLCEASLKDISLIPVKCCGNALVPIDLVKAHLKPTQWNTYRNRLEEALRAGDFAKEEEVDKAMTKLIAEKDWKLCPKCNAVTERVSGHRFLILGCVHMTCLFCKGDFCYTCRKIWKNSATANCHCPTYPDVEIRTILEEPIDRTLVAGPKQMHVENIYERRKRNYEFNRLLE